jgi:alpha-amylase
MIRWHKYVNGETKINRWSNNNSYGYSRGTKGYVLFNSAASTQKYKSLKTGLAAGSYCDVVSGGKAPVMMSKGKRVCRGLTITVAKGGLLSASVPAMTAVAIAPYSKR